ncbi:MarR family transcriptional regulator [Leucobacter sp. gxy201]|uniref:MarR family winged helix-turn-helix transcriptional regulator n=1 Tax=Leucobacter sp. gxy201 TaxID=2957200 RepID=UPI003D9FE8C7
MSHDADVISEIIVEFSEIFAFARTRWAKYAEETHEDLRGAGMMVLQLVTRKGPITATGIGQLLVMDKAVVSRQITKLRELGLVEAEPAAEDRRVVLLTASARAKELLEGLHQQWAHTYHERFADWSSADLEQLRNGLHRFNASSDAQRPDGPARRCAEGHRHEPEA